MAETTASAPSTGNPRLQTSFAGGFAYLAQRLEAWLDAERDQLPLWLPIALGSGIAAWFLLNQRDAWIALIGAAGAVALLALALGRGQRIARVVAVASLAIAGGCGLAWYRAERVESPMLERPQIAIFKGRIERVEQRGEEGWRLIITPDAGAELPSKVRVTAKPELLSRRPSSGDRVTVKARLMPPAEAMVPGAYDFARVAWFQRLGATGKAHDITLEDRVSNARPGFRDRLTAHISRQVDDRTKGIATALVTGDRGAITEADEEAMRDSGLAHLLSISGLHITAVVGAAMFLTLRLLALSQTLALRWPLVTISAAFGAAAGVGYTLLTGSEVPTVRSCIAALLVLIGLAMGREAITLRLVATGALIVLLLWPESLMGPSFQLSFAAITAIVALHENRWFKALIGRREEGLGMRLGRTLISLLITGIVVEVALAPIALFHFHKAGLYGALANIVAIPLTTFVIMPLEALALGFDLVGAGAPFWWLADQALLFLLGLAHKVAEMPGAVAMLPSIPSLAFAAIIGGGLWVLLWRTPVRWLGGVPMLAGAVLAGVTPSPDVLVTGDGKHMAVRGAQGQYAILRPRAGDYVRDVLAERAGQEAALGDLEALREAQCSPDICTVRMTSGPQTWRILATRSHHFVPWRQFIALCAQADVVISDRKLPAACTPHWFKADRPLLLKTGGLAIYFRNGRVETVKREGDQHPWSSPLRRELRPQYRRNSPANLP